MEETYSAQLRALSDGLKEVSRTHAQLNEFSILLCNVLHFKSIFYEGYLKRKVQEWGYCFISGL